MFPSKIQSNLTNGPCSVAIELLDIIDIQVFRGQWGLLEISWIVTPLPSFTSVSQLLNNLTGSNE